MKKNAAREKVKDDVRTRRGMRIVDDRWYWKLRGYSDLALYWIVAFSFPLSIILYLVTGDFWKALAFMFVVQVYNTAGNLRGLFLHIEHLVEWIIKKTV